MVSTFEAVRKTWCSQQMKQDEDQAFRAQAVVSADEKYFVKNGLLEQPC